MIKAIIFDNGGVLVTDTWVIYKNAVSERMGVTPAELKPLLSPSLKNAEVGRISFDQFLSRIAEETKLKEYNNILKTDPKVNPEMVNWLFDLGKEYRLILLTNDVGSFPFSNKKWKLERFFGTHIYNSSKVGPAKPDIEIFRYVLKHENLDANEVVFIDDKSKNTEVANKLGIKTIIFISPEQCKNELQSILERA